MVNRRGDRAGLVLCGRCLADGARRAPRTPAERNHQPLEEDSSTCGRGDCPSGLLASARSDWATCCQLRARRSGWELSAGLGRAGTTQAQAPSLVAANVTGPLLTHPVAG